MALAPGTQLGPYEIVEPLGAGGMGEVYRARDTRLDRTVAIKILPPHLSEDPVRKQRFEREAKAISVLNHPNICTLHDIGSQDGIGYLVMEYVEGELLAHRLEKGPLPLEQALKNGREIADALDRAHRSGIIHRDVKPGNIMLTASGVKLLDFGLARPVSQSTPLATMSANAPQLSPVTEEGTVVGTIQYMSPEQIEGKELDARSDIFSLGAVLYEILTGKRAFEGKSQLSVASAILEKEPTPIGTLKPLAPRSLDHIIRRCLAKTPDDRWQTARDLALELNSVAAGESATQPTAGLSRARKRNVREWVAWGLAAMLLLAATHFFLRARLTLGQSQQLVRASILFPDDREIGRPYDLAVSPDGRLIVFAASAPDGKQQLWLRPLDSLVARPLPGTAGGSHPFWAPDSRWIAFFAGGKLKRVAVDGEAPLAICDSEFGRGGSWGTDGTILFVPGYGSPVFSVPSTGGNPKPVTQLDRSLHELTHRWPQFLPDGKHFLFFSRAPENAIYVGVIGSTERKQILKNNSNAAFVPPGYLLFIRNGVLTAQALDTSRLELSGNALPLAEDVPTDTFTQHGLFSASVNGILAVEPKPGQYVQPVWVDHTGKVEEILGEPALYSFPAVSPDGQRVALNVIDDKTGSWNIWLYAAAGHQKTRLTFESSSVSAMVWSPDGTRILFGSNRLGNSRVFSVPTSGVGQAELLMPSDQSDSPSSWSPDGRFISLDRSTGSFWEAGTYQIWILPMSGGKMPYRLFNSDHPECCAVFSPDGKWLAYVSYETGRPEVYIVPFPEPSLKVSVSSGGGNEPKWSRDGRELYYVNEDGTLTEAMLQPGKNGFQISGRRPLFRLLQSATAAPWFDISRDGKRFLVFRKTEIQTSSAITLITNWTQALPK